MAIPSRTQRALLFQAPATLTVTPIAGQTKVYGANDPTLTYTYTGNVVVGETPSFTGALSYEGTNAGTYNVGKGMLALADNGTFKASNYKMNFVGGVQFTITKATPTANQFTFALPTDLKYDGNAKAVTVAPMSGVAGMGVITVKYYDAAGNPVTPVDVGTYTVRINVTEGTNYTAANDIALNCAFTINKLDSIISGDNADAIYGEKLRMSVRITLPKGSSPRAPEENSVSFYYGSTLLGTADVVGGNGIITGRPNAILDPTGKANRCELATILHRFCMIDERD